MSLRHKRRRNYQRFFNCNYFTVLKNLFFLPDMGNCLPCQKRGGRRRRGLRGRRSTRVHPDFAADTEQIDIVLSNGSNRTRRHLTKGEAKMERELKVDGR